jgi:hypothetical protein
LAETLSSPLTHLQTFSFSRSPKVFITCFILLSFSLTFPAELLMSGGFILLALQMFKGFTIICLIFYFVLFHGSSLTFLIFCIFVFLEYLNQNHGNLLFSAQLGSLFLFIEKPVMFV